MRPSLKRIVKSTVGPDQANGTLLDLLAGRFTYHDRGQWQALIEDGRLTVNEAAGTPDDMLREGDVIEFNPPPRPEPDVDLTYRVVYEDADILAIDKPPNLPCHPAGAFFNHTLWALLKTQHGLAHIAFVNRLDRETSGLVLVGKSRKAARSCRRQFSDRRVTKTYLAIVEGCFPKELCARGHLGPDTASEIKKKRRFTPSEEDAAPEGDSQWAETFFRCRSVHGPLSLVEAIPKTGRLHQIRATLSGMGYPLVGDKLYGVDPTAFLRFCRNELTDTDRGRLRLERQALHAQTLELSHPSTGASIRFEAEMPDDMRLLLEKNDVP